MTTLTNDFHGTEYRTRKAIEECLDIVDRICGNTATDAEKAFVRRVNRALCGMPTCCCGDTLGCRPSLDAVYERERCAADFEED